jgi:hypothetical protein
MNDDTPPSFYEDLVSDLKERPGLNVAVMRASAFPKATSVRMSTPAYERLLAHGELTRLATSGDPLPEDIEVIFDHEAGTVTLSRDPGEPVQVRYTAMRFPKPRREAQWKRETNRRFR